MRVVVADDVMLMRAGIARLLADADVEIVGEAADADQLLRQVAGSQPDIAIVDIRMPPTQTDEGLVAARDRDLERRERRVVEPARALEVADADRDVVEHTASLSVQAQSSRSSPTHRPSRSGDRNSISAVARGT